MLAIMVTRIIATRGLSLAAGVGNALQTQAGCLQAPDSDAQGHHVVAVLCIGLLYACRDPASLKLVWQYSIMTAEVQHSSNFTGHCTTCGELHKNAANTPDVGLKAPAKPQDDLWSSVVTSRHDSAMVLV